MDYAGLHGPKELKGQCWETAWMDDPGGGSLRCEQIIHYNHQGYKNIYFGKGMQVTSM